MIKVLEDTDLFDLFEGGEVTAIAHQANVEGKMGKGIALEIACLYPKSYSCMKLLAPSERSLGNIACVPADSNIESRRRIFHVFAQSLYGSGVKTNYEAFRAGFAKVKDAAIEQGITSIGVPYGIGCGLGGGNWNVIFAILSEIFADEPLVNLFVCKKN